MRISAYLVFGVTASACCLLLFYFTRVRPHTFTMNRSVARQDLAIIAMAAKNFAAEHEGRFPHSLVDLLETDDQHPGNLWGRTTVPGDPWKREYVYAVAADGLSFRVVCYGSDGAPGGSGDAQDLHFDSAEPR